MPALPLRMRGKMALDEHMLMFDAHSFLTVSQIVFPMSRRFSSTPPPNPPPPRYINIDLPHTGTQKAFVDTRRHTHTHTHTACVDTRRGRRGPRETTHILKTPSADRLGQKPQPALGGWRTASNANVYMKEERGTFPLRSPLRLPLRLPLPLVWPLELRCTGSVG